MPKILLIEDNEMNRDMLSRRLQRKGFDVSMAVDGQQGIDAAHQDRPDLIVMDMRLHVLNGAAVKGRLCYAEYPHHWLVGPRHCRQP